MALSSARRAFLFLVTVAALTLFITIKSLSKTNMEQKTFCRWISEPLDNRPLPVSGCLDFGVDTKQTQLRNVERVKLKIAERAKQLHNRIKHKNPMILIEKGRGFHKLVHLDLKGAPPLFSYLLELLPLFRQLGATGLLVEYEDMFPYEGVLENVRKPYAYTSEQIKTFLKKAKKNGLEVIPLVQTFGHLEFVLEHWRFNQLREVYNDDTSICPSNNESIHVLQAMINNVLSLHPDARWIHLGGDEVAHLNKCDLCTARGLSPKKIYTEHVIRMMRHVKKRSNGQTRPIIWDDMLRSLSSGDMKALANEGDVMLWWYGLDVRRRFPRQITSDYARAFKSIWVASSFKGADGADNDFVNITNRIKNNKIWKSMLVDLRRYGAHVQGVALTGWSRYNHHLGLCELLPSALPSLALCLNEWKNTTKSTAASALSKLGISNQKLVMRAPSRNNPYIPTASFPGNDVYSLVAKHELAKSLLHYLSKEIYCYNYRVPIPECDFAEKNYTKLHARVTLAERNLAEFYHSAGRTLEKYFDPTIIEDWIQSKVVRHQSVAQSLVNELSSKGSLAARGKSKALSSITEYEQSVDEYEPSVDESEPSVDDEELTINEIGPDIHQEEPKIVNKKKINNKKIHRIVKIRKLKRNIAKSQLNDDLKINI